MVRFTAARMRVKLALVAVAVGALTSAVVPAFASAHSGPPAAYYRCTSRYASGDAWRTTTIT
jgi:hypothetical protein